MTEPSATDDHGGPAVPPAPLESGKLEAHIRVNPIVRLSVNRRVTMSMLVLGLLVLGWMSLNRLPLEFLPSFSRSSISVSIPYPSSSPDEVERLIVRPLEDSLGTLNGLETLTSSAGSSSANINLSFVDGTDMELAAVDVRDRIDRARSLLPDDIERIRVRRFQSTDIPVLRSSLSATWDRADLYDFVEKVVQPRLERLEGVAQVGTWGLQNREVQINLDAARLTAAGLEPRQVAAALRENSLNVSAGYLRDGSRRMLVRTVGEMRSLQELRALPLRGDGLTVGDVATVEYAFPRRTSFEYLNGAEALSLSINKVSDANLLAVVNRAKAELDSIMAMPEAEGLAVRHFHDASVDVSSGLRELARAGFLGGGLAIVFVLLFLRKWRTTLLIALAVPLSIVCTLVIWYFLRQLQITDMTLNVMSLMGLMLAVGMLLDNSIVVIESIFRHHHDLGEEAKTAALKGASEVAMPIICSTATTMCVFLPLIFFGSSGRSMTMMTNVGQTVCIVMAASLLVSLTVVPLMASILLRAEEPSHAGWLDRLTNGYAWLVRFTIHHRLVFLVAVVLMLWGSWKIYDGIERTFDPPSEGRQLTVHVDVPNRFSAEDRGVIFDQLYGLLDGHREQWEIADIAHEFRTGGGRSRRGSANRIELYLTPEDEAELRTSEIQEQIRAALPVRAGVTYKLQPAQHGPPGGGSSSIRMELIGDELEIAARLSPIILARMGEIPFLRDLDTSLESGDNEILVTVDRDRASALGLSSQSVAQSVSGALSSRNLTYLQAEDRELGVVMQYQEKDRETLEQLRHLPLGGSAGRLPIDSLADFETVEGARSIERENRRSKIEISATVLGDMPSFAAMGMVRQTLGSLQLPQGYEWRFGRSWRDAMDESNDTYFAFAFAILLIYMIMAALFESFVQPFTILFSIPFAFMGVGLIMKLAGQARSSAADMGLLILAGIVVNNAIVLVDHINYLRQSGLSRDEAVVMGGKHRLRPILMTAITTILGLFPMVGSFFLPSIFGQPEGRAAFWAPVGLVILGGLTTSTVLTLLVIPTLYTFFDDFKQFFVRVWRTA